MLLKYCFLFCGLAAIFCACDARADDAGSLTQILAEHDMDPQPTVYQQRFGAPATLSVSTATNDIPSAARIPSSKAMSSAGVGDYSIAHPQAELSTSGFYNNDPSSAVTGGNSYGLDSMIYSPTIANRWRLFAGEMYSRENEPFGEGAISYSRSTAGIEYDQNGIRITGAPTFNAINGQNRTGFAGDARWTLNDHWRVGGGVQTFSRDAPLRALNAGITAHSYNLNADFYQENDRDISLDADILTFSDNNIRRILTGSDSEHLYAGNDFKVDGLGTIVESQNSENEDRSYYNPAHDLDGLIGARVTQLLYSKYDIVYDHHIEAQPGAYWQQGYGVTPVITATYAQHINYKDDVDGSLGVTFTRQDSNGTAENSLSTVLSVSKKF